MVVRLVRCLDNVPTSTNPLVSGAADEDGNANYGYIDTTCAILKQAACNTDSSDGSICSNNNNADDSGHWRSTLSGTTIADVASGVASFADLQVRSHCPGVHTNQLCA